MANPCNYRKHRTQHIEWQKAVFERDKYKCTECGKTEKLTAHHKCKDSQLCYEVGNGKTLCEECHLRKEQNIWNKNNPRRRVPNVVLDEVRLRYGGWRS